MTSRTDEKPQRDRFIEAARELGADDDEATFKAKLAVIAKQKPPATDDIDVAAASVTSAKLTKDSKISVEIAKEHIEDSKKAIAATKDKLGGKT